MRCCDWDRRERSFIWYVRQLYRPEKRRRSAALHKAGVLTKPLSKIPRLMECGAPAPLSAATVSQTSSNLSSASLTHGSLLFDLIPRIRACFFKIEIRAAAREYGGDDRF
jgi:hypothetical protein